MEVSLQRLVLLLLIAPGTSVAQTYDHLEPDDSVFGWEWSRDYYANVVRVLGNVVPERSPKVFVLPSNIQEYVVGIDDETTPCVIVVGQVEHTLWLYESRKSDSELLELTSDWPADPLDVEVVVSSQSASRQYCSRIREVWVNILLKTRYPDISQIRVGTDGVSFHFSVWVRGMGSLYGKIWSPDRQSVQGKLVALTRAMRIYARSGSTEDFSAVDAALTEIESALE